MKAILAALLIFFAGIAPFTSGNESDVPSSKSEPTDAPRISGPWKCLHNKERYTLEMEIEQSGPMFTGVDTIVAGACCVDTKSELSRGHIDNQGELRFVRENGDPDYKLHQIFEGKATGPREKASGMSGTFRHLAGYEFDWTCSRNE